MHEDPWAQETGALLTLVPKLTLGALDLAHIGVDDRRVSIVATRRGR